MKEMLYEVRCLKSNEDMILALAGQFKQLFHEPHLTCKLCTNYFGIKFLYQWFGDLKKIN